MNAETTAMGSPQEIYEQFTSWLRVNLPDEWRSAQRWSPKDDEVISIRRKWGRMLFEARWLAPGLPESVGGLGLATEGLAAYYDALSEFMPPEPLNANAIGILAPTLLRFGTTEQVETFIPPMLGHEVAWCQGFSEPNAGSDLASLRTHAEKDGANYRIFGQKIWTSRAHVADYCYALIRTTRGSRGREGLSLIIVPMRQEGVTVRPIRNLVGAAEFAEVFFDGAVAPMENRVGPEGEGWKVATYALTRERGSRMLDRAFGLRKILSDVMAIHSGLSPDRKQVTADELLKLELDTLAVVAMARRIVSGSTQFDDPTTAAVSKVAASELRQKLLDFASRLLSEPSILADDRAFEWSLAQMFARAETIYGGSSEVQRNIIARSLGLPSSASGARTR